MCYETSLSKKLKSIEKQPVRLCDTRKFMNWYHLSGFSHPNMFCIPMDDPDTILPMEWGLLAPWADDILKFRKKYNTLNAKAETLLTSNMYKEAVRERRCLILADGFFEPHYEKMSGPATPYYCYLEDRKLFSFAGIYNKYDEDYWTVSLTTREANDFFAEIHNKKKRMPLAIDRNFEGEWLDPDLNDNGIEEVLATSFMREPFKAHPVTRDLYKRGINTNIPEILENVEKNPNLFNE